MVTEVDEVLVRHRDQALVEHGQASDTGVEHTDRAGVHPAIVGWRRAATGPDRHVLVGRRRARRSTGTRRGPPPRARLAYYAERFSTVEVDSTFYRVPTESMVQGWAERTPPGFVMHVKAFGLMTRHPVKLEQVPPDLREGLPVDERGRVDRPPREARGRVPRVPRRARSRSVTPGSSAVSSSRCRRTSCGSPRRSTTWSGRASRSARTRFCSNRGTGRGSTSESATSSCAGSRSAGSAGWSSTRRRSRRETCPRRSSRRRRRSPTSASTGATPAPGTCAAASAAQRFDHLYGEDELREWVGPLRELSNAAEEAYAFFNNNNQTNGVAQAPAGAVLLRKLLEQEGVPTG